MHNGLGAWPGVVLAIWLLGWWVVGVHGQTTNPSEPSESLEPTPCNQIIVPCNGLELEYDDIIDTTNICGDDMDEITGVPPNVTIIPISTSLWVVFKVERCDWTDEQDITITTCSDETKNATVLLQLSGDPGGKEEVTDTLSNRFDANCASPPMKATLQYRVDPVTEEADYLYFALAFHPGFEEDGGVVAKVRITSEKVAVPTRSLFWGQDRLDQRDQEPELYPADFVGEPGSGVVAYVVDSGILRTHSQFAGGQVVSELGQNFVEPDAPPDDCNGHGTFVSALMAGSTFGVARQTTIVPVKVLDCENRGRTANLMRAINWILEKNASSQMILMPVFHQLRDEQSPLSSRIQTVLSAQNITLVAAAGTVVDSPNATDDQIRNTCDQTQPLSDGTVGQPYLGNVLSVGASDRNDALASFSPWGNCSAIYAPGTEITSAYHTGDYATAIFSSTAAASGFAAGAVAVLLGLNKGMSGVEINRAIVNMGTKEALSLRESELNQNTLLFVRGVRLEFPHLQPLDTTLNIYFIYKFSELEHSVSDGCSLADAVNETLVERVEEYLKANNAWLDETTVQIPFCWQEGEEPPVVDSRSAVVRQKTVQMLSRQAAGPYLVIESAVPSPSPSPGGGENTLAQFIEEETSYNISEVVAVPWVVDSVGRRYWAAPVPVATPDGLSQGVIAGIVLGSILLFSLLISAVLVIIRWRKPPEVEVQITQGPAKADGRTVVEFHDDPSPGIEILPRRTLDVPLTGLETATVMSAESSEIELENTNFQVESIDGGEAWIWNADNEEIGLGFLGGMIDHLRASNRSDMSEYSGRDILDAPLHAESVGSQTFLLGGGMSGRLSFEDMPSTVAVTRSTVAPLRGVDVLHPIVRLHSFEEEIFLE